MVPARRVCKAEQEDVAASAEVMADSMGLGAQPDVDIAQNRAAPIDSLENTIGGNRPLASAVPRVARHSFLRHPGLDHTVASRPGVAQAGLEWRFAKDWTAMAKLEGEFSAGSHTYAATGRVSYAW